MDRATLSSAIERAVRTFIQVGAGVGTTQATGAGLSTTSGIIQFIITTIVTALVMAYATPAREDVKRTPDPVFIPTVPKLPEVKVNDINVGDPDAVLRELEKRIPGLDELRKKFGR